MLNLEVLQKVNEGRDTMQMGPKEVSQECKTQFSTGSQKKKKLIKTCPVFWNPASFLEDDCMRTMKASRAVRTLSIQALTVQDQTSKGLNHAQRTLTVRMS